IYPLNMGVQGAAWATVIGQSVSLIVAMLFHYLANKEIGGHPKYIKPVGGLIKEIYHIGFSAAIMQGLLSVMMLGVNLILGTVKDNAALLQGSFGIYYKIMQFALFACFGLSNTIITALSFNYGTNNKRRSVACIKWGIADSVIVSLAITVLFESLAVPLAKLFGMASGASGEEITAVVVNAIRISSIGYVFMGISIAVQGVLQALRYSLYPLIISALRLVVLVFPVIGLFTLSESVSAVMWWTFPIVEVITCIFSVFVCKRVYDKKIKPME
ncbi:MAG: MATE family efflux transporter, partial [Candidatus Coproplasma sp.]